jgi:nucleoside-diphosphate-sugar epimerase
VKVIVFGATGMIGQGVLRACLLDEGVTEVLVIGRSPTAQRHAKLREIRHENFTDFTPIAAEFAGSAACLFCLGVSSVGMSEADYRRVTYDFTLAAARTLAERSPDAAFLYISGQGTDSSGRGPTRCRRAQNAP